MTHSSLRSLTPSMRQEKDSQGSEEEEMLRMAIAMSLEKEEGSDDQIGGYQEGM